MSTGCDVVPLSPEAPETKEQWMVQDGRGSGVWNRTYRQSARGTSLMDLTWSSSAQTQALALSSGYDSSLWAAAMHQQGLVVTVSFQGFPVAHMHYAFVACWSQGGLQSALTTGYRQTKP